MADAQKVQSSSSSWPGRRKRRSAIAGFVEGKNARLVTYSKRRPDLFKKAPEACLHTGCSVAIVGFSPAGRPFSFSSQPTCSSSNDFLDSYLAGEIDAVAFAVPPPPPSEEITELALVVAELDRRVTAKKSTARSLPTLEELRAAKRRVEAIRLAVLAR